MRPNPSRESLTLSVTPASENVETTASLRVPACPNCGDNLRGRFCSSCGQRVQGPDRVRDIAWEWARAVASADGILWSTLGALVVNPGKLTRDWWDGRRANRMSPVRVLLTVILFGSLVSWAEHLLVGRAEADIGLLLQVFTYQIAIVAMIVIPTAMRVMLPSSIQRTTYQHLTFALYQSTVFGLMSCLAMLLLIFGGYAPSWLQDLTLNIAPATIPIVVSALFAHATVHMKGAYGVGWVGAGIRTAVLAVCIILASLIATMILTFTGLSQLWMPGLDEPVARFERVGPQP